MSDDFEAELMKHRNAALDAELAQASANYQLARNVQDYQSANDAIDTIQRIQADKERNSRMYQEHQRSQTRSAPVMTDKEFEAMSPQKMAQHPEAVDRIFSKSKYYSKDQWADPEVQQRIRLGMEEVERRRGMGR